MPRIAAAWAARHGREPGPADVDAVYDVFVPMNIAVAADHADMIEGAVAIIDALRARGLGIGSTTGYTREIMAPLRPWAAAQGYAPDCLVCAGDVPEGRPSPLMMWRAFQEFRICSAGAVVEVDDTEVGIGEGLNACCWTVGVALTGNVFGLSPAETAALPPTKRVDMRAAAHGRLRRAGAHHVVDSVADLLPVVDLIEGALARGERP